MKHSLSNIARLVSISLIAASTGALADDCVKERWLVDISSPHAVVNWTVKKGASCESLNRKGFVDNFRVLGRAKHGVAGVTSSMADRGFAYRASGSYTGPDEFEIGCDMHPSYQTEAVPATITVKVTVVDKL